MDTNKSYQHENEVLPSDAKVLDFHKETEKSIHKMDIQKTGPITNLIRSNLSLTQLKILDIYLARINSRDPESRFVCISNKDLARILRTDHIDPKTMRNLVEGEYDDKRRLIRQGLLGYPIYFDDPEESHTEVLFSTARYRKDQYGVYSLTLGCSEEAKKYIFYEKGIHYLRSKIFFVMNLKSRYSYALYFLILGKLYSRTPRSVEISLEELREELKATDASYNEFKRFHSQVLKPAVAEVNEKTDLRTDYSLVKRGKTVVGVRFDVTCLLTYKRALEYIKDGKPYSRGDAAVFAEDQAEQEWEEKCRSGKVPIEEIREHYDIPENASSVIRRGEDDFLNDLITVSAMEYDRKEMKKAAQRRYYAQKDELEKAK